MKDLEISIRIGKIKITLALSRLKKVAKVNTSRRWV